MTAENLGALGCLRSGKWRQTESIESWGNV